MLLGNPGSNRSSWSYSIQASTVFKEFGNYGRKNLRYSGAYYSCIAFTVLIISLKILLTSHTSYGRIPLLAYSCCLALGTVSMLTDNKTYNELSKFFCLDLLDCLLYVSGLVVAL